MIARIKEAHDHGLTHKAMRARHRAHPPDHHSRRVAVLCGDQRAGEFRPFPKPTTRPRRRARRRGRREHHSRLLVPLMALMGKWNWWAPRWLKRLHAAIGLDEGDLAEVPRKAQHPHSLDHPRNARPPRCRQPRCTWVCPVCRASWRREQGYQWPRGHGRGSDSVKRRRAGCPWTFLIRGAKEDS